MRMLRGTLVAVLSLIVVATAAHAAIATEPLGTWLTEDGKAVVTIDQCDDGLCGKISWLREPMLDGANKVDANNRLGSQRERALIGLQVLQGFDQEPNGKGEWKGGQIYDPRNGKTYYRCTLTIDQAGSVKITGYADLKRPHGRFVRAKTRRTVVWTPSQGTAATR